MFFSGDLKKGSTLLQLVFCVWGGHMNAAVIVGRLEGSSQESALSFHISPGEQTVCKHSIVAKI